MNMFELYFLIFFIYSIAGWIAEVICKSFQYKRFVNRGFLIGPYCPIYGVGALLIVILLYQFTSHVGILFIMSLLICSLLEYFTSYVMEKIFRARWWDYSKKRFNINGRICLSTMIPFGIGGCVIAYFVHPFLLNFVQSLPELLIHLLFFSIFILFCTDAAISFHFIYKIRNISVKTVRDNTEEITKKVKKILIKKSGIYRRLVNAYPTFKVAVRNKKDLIKKKLAQDIRLKRF